MMLFLNVTLQRLVVTIVLLFAMLVVSSPVHAESIAQIDNDSDRYVWVESDERFSAYFDVTQLYVKEDGAEIVIGVPHIWVDRVSQVVFKHRVVYKYNKMKVPYRDSGITLYYILNQAYTADGREGNYTNAPEIDTLYAADVGWLEYTLAHAVYKRVFGKDYEPKH